MKISKRTEYGLRAMVLLANSQKVLSIREISNIAKMPFEFLSKIFIDLEKAKLVKAKRGGNGGYCLARPAQKISVADIVVVLEEDLSVVHCSGCPMAGSCTSENVWQEVEQSMSATMGKRTLADLVKKPKSKK